MTITTSSVTILTMSVCQIVLLTLLSWLGWMQVFKIVVPIVTIHINSHSVAQDALASASIGLFAFAKWIQIKEASLTQWNKKKTICKLESPRTRQNLKNKTHCFMQPGVFQRKSWPNLNTWWPFHWDMVIHLNPAAFTVSAHQLHEGSSHSTPS